MKKQTAWYCQPCMDYFEVILDVLDDTNYCPMCGKDIIDFIGECELEGS